MKITGKREIDGKGQEHTRLYIDGIRLSYQPSLKVYNHSPGGFQFGYGGSGVAQAALAILMTQTDNLHAERLHQAFKWEFLAIQDFHATNFTIDIDIKQWLLKKGATPLSRTIGLSLFDEETELKDEIDLTQQTNQMVYCSPGKEGLCATAQSKSCQCRCQGANHGLWVRQKLPL